MATPWVEYVYVRPVDGNLTFVLQQHNTVAFSRNTASMRTEQSLVESNLVVLNAHMVSTHQTARVTVQLRFRASGQVSAPSRR